MGSLPSSALMCTGDRGQDGSERTRKTSCVFSLHELSRPANGLSLGFGRFSFAEVTGAGVSTLGTGASLEPVSAELL